MEIEVEGSHVFWGEGIISLAKMKDWLDTDFKQ